MTPKARRRLALVVLSSALLAGCGSTVRGGAGTTEAAGNGGIADGSAGQLPTGGSVGVGSNSGGGDQSGSTGSTSGGGLSGPDNGGSTSGGSTGGPSTVRVPRSTESGPGVTKTTINVGITEIQNAEAVNQAAGVGEVTRGNPNAYAEAVLDDINRHGGAAGRKLVPVWHVRDATSAQTIEAQDEAACADWTQDHKVFAVMGASSDSFQQCATRARVVQVDDNVAIFDASALRRYPGVFELCCPSLDRIAAQQVVALAEQKYFTPWDFTLGQPGTAPAKVGVLTLDDPAFRNAVKGVLAPGLSRLGYPPEVAYVTKPRATSEVSEQAAAIQSAGLRFRANGVSHVIILEQAGTLSLLFLKNAQSQQYYPRYGTNSMGFFQGLIANDYAAPEQFNGALGFGWIPNGDLPADRNPDDGPYSNTTRRHCMKVMKEHGQTFSSPNAQLIALLFCDELYFLRDVLNRTGPVINYGTFINAAERLGSTFVNGSTLGQHFAPGRHDGVSEIYYWNYFPDCTCMHYTGPRRRI